MGSAHAEPWFAMGVAWIYEVIVFLFVWLSLIGVSEGAYFTSPGVVKWLLLVAAVINLGIWGYAGGYLGHWRKAYTWHFGAAVWFYSFASIGSFWWHSQYADPLFNPADPQPYIVWKGVLCFAAVMATLSIVTMIFALVVQFTRIEIFRRVEKKTRSLSEM